MRADIRVMLRRLQFAEVYFTAAGDRVFSVLIDGVTKISGLVRLSPSPGFGRHDAAWSACWSTAVTKNANLMHRCF